MKYIRLIAAALALTFVSVAQAQVSFNYQAPALGSSEAVKRNDLNAELTGINTDKVDFVDIDTSAELRGIITDETGTGALMFGLTPSMDDGLGCTASQIVRRNGADNAFECATGAAGLASTDIDTSAELRAIMTDEIGTGFLVFLGTPADDQVPVGDSATGSTWRTVPTTSATQKLSYDQATNLFSAVTDDDIPEAGDYTNLSATSPITQSGGTISTSISTARLVGRTTAAAGVMEQIAVDSTLSLSALTLSVVDVTCTACLGTTEVAALDAANDITTGLLAVARGGNGAAPGADDQVVVSSSTSAAAWTGIPDSDLATQKLQYDITTNAFSAGTDDDIPDAGDYTNLSATSPITQSGGTISTSIATAKLVGRTTAATGVMEQIGVDATLSLSALTLGVVDVTCTACLGTTEIAALDAANDITTGSLADARMTLKTESFCVAASDETTAITTGTAKTTFRMPYAFTLTNIRGSLNTVSSSGSPIIDVNEAGTSVMTTNKVLIDVSEKTSVTAVTAVTITDTALADDAEMTVDVDTAGTGAKGLKICLIGHQ